MENRISNVKHTYTAFIEKNEKLFHDLVSSKFMIETGQKYLDWLMSTFQEKKTDMPLKDIITVLDKFNKLSGRLSRRNIYSYNDINDVQHAVADYLNKEQKKKTAKSGVETIIDTNEWRVDRILSVDALNPLLNDDTYHKPDFGFVKFIKKGMLFFVASKNLRTDVIVFKPFGLGHGLEFYKTHMSLYHQTEQESLKNLIPRFIIERIEAYSKTHDEVSKFLTFTEFDDLLYKKVIETYIRPKIFYNKFGHQILGTYLTEATGLKLVYEIPHYNVRLFVDLHLFEHNSPMTIETQDMTAKDEKKEKIFRMSYENTAFKSRQLCFNLLNKAKNGPELCLKMIEFTISMFIEFPAFHKLFTGEIIYWGAGNYAGNELVSPTAKRAGTKPAPSADRLLDYIKEREEKSQPATKYDYVRNFLKKPDVIVRGYQTVLFGELLRAGIIKKEKYKDGLHWTYTYKLGPNYLPYKEGRLRHLSWRSFQ